MKKEEYLRKALLLVSNPYTKAQVQQELEDHIEDEISFYTDAVSYTHLTLPTTSRV